MVPQHSPCHQGSSPGHVVGLLVQLTPSVAMLCAEALEKTLSIAEPAPTMPGTWENLAEDVIYLLFGDRVSCGLGWPGTHCVARDDSDPLSHW